MPKKINVSPREAETIDGLIEKSTKLQAMLLAIQGDGLKPFNNLAESVQDTYLWACSDLASELMELAQRLGENDV
ncbi:hypothetical protein [Noviherbaspirillum galbum]|uniref:Uncharacterized protein n=1 Tax=Noviherbaspirillum galbum TaxID=2709383 RepID=A0A6B3SYZ0_9BURK|nr:hypothetical protein [Noviherbaspirillum galbum]NEX63459.1 hypothetical protein [Noviherbaspirillum galbum]